MAKLAAYEDAEGEGRLKVLPVAVGQEIYVTTKDGPNFEIFQDWVCDIQIEIYREKETINIHPETTIPLEYGILGRDVFLTPEEAEKALRTLATR